MLRMIIFFIGLAFVLLVFRFLIKGKMSERTSLPWIACSFFVIILSVYPYSLDAIARLVNVDYPPALLFLVSILVIFLLLLYQSIHLSILQQKIRELAQTISIMKSTGVAEISKDPIGYGDITKKMD
ncbi:MAG: hypothetical protein AWM53_01697 [Candidatus Dichloromethanomonas elyunquensis]|nr:MAG: hypothetical protein AWM53_01697 [Candidatus Dichloromethanomonas elyunquensis]